VNTLILGSEGQVGWALLAAAPRNIAVTGLGRRDLDITDEAAVLSCVRKLKPEVIINAAAYTAVDRAESESNAAHRVNAEGARYIALAARDCGSRLVQISTDFVFDGSASSPYRVAHPTNPLNVYGKTKRAGEEAVLEVWARQTVVLRTAWVYASKGSNFVLTMLRNLGSKGAVRVVADQIGTPTSAASLSRTIWQIVQRPELCGIYHWTDAGVASWYDFAVAIAEEGSQLGLLPANVVVSPIGTDEYPTAARRPSYSVLDKSDLMSLGMAPAHWRTELRGVLQELRH
jgi:dTDP-4-dehydrorhamnose reductase